MTFGLIDTKKTPPVELNCKLCNTTSRWNADFATSRKQVLDRVWHVPIRGEDGGPGTKWLCIDFSAAANSGESRQTKTFKAGDSA